MSFESLTLPKKLEFGQTRIHSLSLRIGKNTRIRGIQNYNNADFRIARPFQGQNSHIEGWLDGAGEYIKVEDIRINRECPNSIYTIYRNKDGKVVYAGSELIRGTNENAATIIDTIASSSECCPMSIEATKQTISADGKYGIYELCFNKDTGMYEYVLVKTGSAKSANVSMKRQFDASTGIETYLFDDPNILNDIKD